MLIPAKVSHVTKEKGMVTKYGRCVRWTIVAALGMAMVLLAAAQTAEAQRARGRRPRTTAAGEWPQFRGPGGLGVSDSKDTPVTWSASQNLLWKFELAGAGSSSPIVVGDRVFVTCYTGYGVRGQAEGQMAQLTRHVLCLNAANGRLLWKADVPAILPESDRVREHGYAASTPACDGERLYVFFGKSGVFAFTLDGKQLWKTSVGSNHHGWGSAASPVVYGDLLIVNACVESESLVALDKKTGKEKWRAGGIKESWNTPLIVPGKGGAELIVAVFGKILAFKPDTGQALWSADTDIQWYIAPSMVAQSGIVYAIGGRSGVAALAVRTGGRGDVTGTHRLWTSTNGSNVSSPIIDGGHLYWMHDNEGIAYCADAATGRIIYEVRVPRAGQVYASPILCDGKLYYVNRSGVTFVLKSGTAFELLAVNDLSDGSTFDASPAVAGGRLYLRSDRFVYCVGNR